VPYEFKIQRRVEFHETDMAGIVHFTNFFRYMEAVEHAFYRSLGFSVAMNQLSPKLGLPRVHASCDYRRPLRFEDLIEIHLKVREKKTRSITYDIHFLRVEPGPIEEVAVGRLTVVCVAKNKRGDLEPAPLPEKYFAQIEAARS
jgi:acyl-CoA thioester hydrolase